MILKMTKPKPWSLHDDTRTSRDYVREVRAHARYRKWVEPMVGGLLVVAHIALFGALLALNWSMGPATMFALPAMSLVQGMSFVALGFTIYSAIRAMRR